ncbi:hypothetical protein OAN21_02035 [Alphaproteobacteria bacterium]|nr:hypothetical protein [Alphaproteobacteria bacterium]
MCFKLTEVGINPRKMMEAFMILALFQRSAVLFVLFTTPSLLTQASFYDSENDYAGSESSQRLSPKLLEEGDVRMEMDTARPRMHSMDLARPVIENCGFEEAHQQAHISQAEHFLQLKHSDEDITYLMGLGVRYAHEIKPHGKDASAYEVSLFLSQAGKLLEDRNSLDSLDFSFRALSHNAPRSSLDAQEYYLKAFSWIFFNTRDNAIARHIADYSFQFMRPDHTEAECSAIISHVHEFVSTSGVVRPAALSTALDQASHYQSWEVVSYLAGFIAPYTREAPSPIFSDSPAFSPNSPSYSPPASDDERRGHVQGTD